MSNNRFNLYGYSMYEKSVPVKLSVMQETVQLVYLLLQLI
jgi:hypothetical protein